MYQKTKQKCPLLIGNKYDIIFLHCPIKFYAILGYDPAELHPWLDKSNYIKKGDAVHVQLIHTSGFLGTKLRTGDVDVSVKYKSSWHIVDNHFMGYRIQEMSTSKRFAFIANRNGPGSIIKLNDTKHFESIKANIKKDQCLLGVTSNKNNVGKFRITVTDEDLNA